MLRTAEVYPTARIDLDVNNITDEQCHAIYEDLAKYTNAYTFNYVRCSQAQTLSQQLSTGGKTGSLMLGIQWDWTCKFLETKGGLTQAEIKGGDEIESTNWGNYSSCIYTIGFRTELY